MLNKVINQYIDKWGEVDTYPHLYFDLGAEAYLELFQKALTENKFIYLQLEKEQLDGGKIVFLNDPSEIEQKK